MSVNGVVTTGIYCRRGCAAKPHEEHIRIFANPAAAEAAGFRACLRCRPYRGELTVDWQAPALVCRAVRMILDGALDKEDSEEALGSRLGVSGRHLRRLFLAHLGATPDQLARSRRAHFARRLLDDTDLSIGEVAFAAGFGSIRQFNRACSAIFRATPSELRTRRRKKDRLVADGGLALRLPYRGELEFDAMLAYLKARAIPGVESVSDGTYRRTVVIDGDPGVIEISPGDGDHLVLVAHLPHWENLIHIVERARQIFNLDADVEAVARHFGGDPLLAPLVRARPGLRPPGTWDPFETGVRAIVGQQVSVAGATTLIGRIAASFGSVVPGLQEMSLTHLFPTPAALADGDLRGLGLTTARAETITQFAATVAHHRLALEVGTELDAFEQEMSALPGIGHWTAQYLALRMGERDALPTSDLGLLRSLTRLRGENVEAAQLRELARTWSPFRAFAAIHLWLSS